MLAATALAAAGGLTACGGDGGGTTAGSATQTAPARTQARTQAQTQTQTRPRTTTTSAGGVSAAVLATGRSTFLANGCSGCHTLAAAGATGTVGPDLDQVLPGKSAAFIHQSIVSPNAQIASGFSAGIMPSDFGQRISAGDLAALVAFLRTQAGR